MKHYSGSYPTPSKALQVGAKEHEQQLIQIVSTFTGKLPCLAVHKPLGKTMQALAAIYRETHAYELTNASTPPTAAIASRFLSSKERFHKAPAASCL
jgi:hypothetical protein